MAKNIELMGAVFPDVPSIKLPQYGGGLVSFDDTSDADAVAEDITEGKTAYVNGVKVVGTNQGGGGGITIKTLTKTMTSNATIIEFPGLESEPKAFYIEQTTNTTLTSTSANVWVTGVFYDGASISVTNSGLSARTTASLNHSSNSSWNYSNGTLTVKNSGSTNGGYFRNGVTYKLVYMY